MQNEKAKKIGTSKNIPLESLSSELFSAESPVAEKEQKKRYCTVIFRPGDQPGIAINSVKGLKGGELVMVQTERGPEPAEVLHKFHPGNPGAYGDHSASNGNRKTLRILRRANQEDSEKYQATRKKEQQAFMLCQKLIEKHKLPMKLIKVDSFFNGSKMVFYFTAENRVDFRTLVKDLVQEYRTRIEIRQVGVRHETKMIGGLGCCGREMCCSSHLNQFMPVSIKMAKEQDLPLNPAKISGICNRLLCCLTYEFDTYRQVRRKMPKPGKTVRLDGREFKVVKLNVLKETVEVCATDEPDRLISWQESEWRRCSKT